MRKVPQSHQSIKWALLVTLITLLTIWVAVGGCAPQKAQKVTLKVVLLPYLAFAPFFIGEEEGYFAEQGLEVEFVKFAGAAQAMPLLAQGSLHVGAGAISASKATEARIEARSMGNLF